MPIDFPSNPVSGQTYAFGDQKWQYNGVAWDKLLIADDANALYGISGSIYASSLATGLLYGGILSINAGNSAQFDITAGRGQIHAAGSTYTANPQPTLQYVTWAGQTGITLTYLATNDTTWIYIDSAGTVQQRTEYYTDDQLEENIIIGQLVHPSRTFINLARTNPNVAYATDKQYEQFIRSFGPIKISGHTIQPNGANLKLNRTSGTAFSLGRNWINDTDNPSVVSDSAQTDCIFYRYYRGVTAGSFITVPNETVIDPTKYDDGTGTLASVPGGKYTIQRLFYYPNTPTLLGVYYGRAQYTSLADAAANINFENFTEIENTKTNAIFVAYLLIKSGCTEITNTSDALILQAGNFRSTTSGGGSVSLTLDDLTDVIITSPQNYQVLTYVDGGTGWENSSVTSLPLVSSFNGLTGAVTGVTTGVANTFGPLQSFTVGISAAGATFTGNIILQNAEFIRNSTNGRIDLMPAPAGSTHYGLSIDTTSWGSGPRLGTIRSSDNALNTAAILWDVPLTLAANVRFNFGSNGQNGVVLSDTGNDTIQLFTNVTSGTNSGAVAIVDAVGINAANRAPGTTHANPNLYIYRAGSARATDFIRFEHDGNTGFMVTGGTTDIGLLPGSGIVGVSGDIQVTRNRIYVTNNARSWFL